MICICLDDMIMKKAKYEQIAIETKSITNTLLCTVTGVLVGTGVIGIAVVGNCMLIIGVNKVAKVIIRKTGVVNKMREYVIKKKLETAV